MKNASILTTLMGFFSIWTLLFPSGANADSFSYNMQGRLDTDKSFVVFRLPREGKRGAADRITHASFDGDKILITTGFGNHFSFGGGQWMLAHIQKGVLVDLTACADADESAEPIRVLFDDDDSSTKVYQETYRCGFLHQAGRILPQPRGRGLRMSLPTWDTRDQIDKNYDLVDVVKTPLERTVTHFYTLPITD